MLYEDYKLICKKCDKMFDKSKVKRKSYIICCNKKKYISFEEIMKIKNYEYWCDDCNKKVEEYYDEYICPHCGYANAIKKVYDKDDIRNSLLNKTYFYDSHSIKELKDIRDDSRTSKYIKCKIDDFIEKVEKMTEQSLKKKIDSLSYEAYFDPSLYLPLFIIIAAFKKTNLVVSDELKEKIKLYEQKKERYMKEYFSKKAYKKWLKGFLSSQLILA